MTQIPNQFGLQSLLIQVSYCCVAMAFFGSLGLGAAWCWLGVVLAMEVRWRYNHIAPVSWWWIGTWIPLIIFGAVFFLRESTERIGFFYVLFFCLELLGFAAAALTLFWFLSLLCEAIGQRQE